MFKKKYLLVLLLIFVIGSISAVSASEINQTDVNDNLKEISQEIEVVSNGEYDSLQSTDDADEMSAISENPLQAIDSTQEEVLAGDNTKDVNAAGSTPKHVNLAISDKAVTYGKIQHIKVKVTDDNGNPLEGVSVMFKILKNNKVVDKQVDYVTGKEGYLYYCTDQLKAGNYKVKCEIIDKDIYTATPVTSKLTVKKIKLTAKIKKDVGELEIIVKKNKKPVNKIKLKVKIYTGKKYKTIYLKSGYNKKISKHKGFCGFATNDLKVGKHKVVITSANKNYKLSKTTKIKITKSIKKVESILAIVSNGKLYLYTGF